MPFTRDGVWTDPTEEDINKFNKSLSTDEVEIVPPTEDLLRAIVATVPTNKPYNSNIFKAIGNIKGGVDIVVPVFNGLHVLKLCLESVKKYTNWKYKIIIVDDCSTDPKISDYLSTKEDIVLKRNQNNRGFAASVNYGVASGTNPYVCVLNSDTIVTEDWLTKMLVALEADPKNIIVNPATNNTALTNVDMYPGTSYLDMAKALDRGAELKYNEIMPTGFCLMFRRKLWDEMGPFDESFHSYGEESHFWFRSIKRTDKDGNITKERAVIADNAYVFHERGTSFSQLGEGAHTKQRRSGSERFHTLNPDFPEWNKGFDVNASIGHLRNRIPREAFLNEYKGNIAWVVKSSGPCGGMFFITDIINELIERGYNAKVCVIPDDPENTNLPVCSNLHTRPIRFASQEDFVNTFADRVFNKGIVLAAVSELSPCVWELGQRNKGILGKNHVQSWDVDLAKLVGKEDVIDQIIESYKRLPNIVSSGWVAKEIEAIGGKVENIVLPGVNEDLFHPRNRKNGDSRFTIAVLLTEPAQYKGGEWGKELLGALREKNRGRDGAVRIIAIGPSYLPVQGITCVGSMSQARMAEYLATEVDVFVDPAEVHSYGLPALEGLFSDCYVLVRENKGYKEYSSYWPTELYAENDVQKAVAWIMDKEPLKDPKDNKVIICNELLRSSRVDEFIKAVFPAKEVINKQRIEVITPHLRKHGGPTTNIVLAQTLRASGHNVSMSTIYTDWNPGVLELATGLNIRTAWKEVPEEVSTVVINSDNPFAGEIMDANPHKKYIMYKLSHNERFKAVENDNLNLPWDHIITSTEWLRQACLIPKEGWPHRAWPEDKVTRVGWYHYGHSKFNQPPSNKVYGTSDSGFRLGTLIHAHQLKGSAVAIGVIEGLKKKYEARFHAVGFGETKAKLPWHMQYIQSASRVDFAFAMKQLDIWLGASYTEGLGRLALEAMSAGVAVVTTNTGAEFLKDGVNCLLYEPGKAQEAALLVDKLANNQDLFTNLVVNGHETAVKAADSTEFSRKLIEVIQKVNATQINH